MPTTKEAKKNFDDAVKAVAKAKLLADSIAEGYEALIERHKHATQDLEIAEHALHEAAREIVQASLDEQQAIKDARIAARLDTIKALGEKPLVE